MTSQAKRDYVAEGERAYREWSESLVDTPEKRALYECKILVKIYGFFNILKRKIFSGINLSIKVNTK